MYAGDHNGTDSDTCVHKGDPCAEIHHYHMYYSKSPLFRRFEFGTINDLLNDYRGISWTWDSRLKIFLIMN